MAADPRPAPAEPKEGLLGDADTTLRAFFAVELGEPARRTAAEVARQLHSGPGGDDVRWVRSESLHVTLHFLGQIPRERVPSLAQCVGEEVAPLSPFRLELDGVRGFPSPRRPRVVVMDVSPRAPLEGLARAVERGVVAAGFEPEARPFRAHLTLGRVRGRRAPSAGAPPALGANFDVTETVLFRSELRPSGSRYTALERIRLEGGLESPP
ncbi:MAG: RNA 2',3'-cyclic phosphodiesterase [Myxococcota bacterium]